MDIRKYKSYKKALLAANGSYGIGCESFNDIVDYCGLRIPNGGFYNLEHDNIRIFNDESFELFCKEKSLESAWCICNKIAYEAKSVFDYRFILVSEKNNCAYVNSDFKDGEQDTFITSLNKNEIISSYKIIEKQLEMYELVKNANVCNINELYKLLINNK